MQLKESYLQRVVGEVEELAERVAVLKAQIAKQKVGVTLQHRGELAYLRISRGRLAVPKCCCCSDAV
jgi:hypothetical protein